MKIDVVVIGGGPAGLFAAYSLNQHKIEYVLIERGARIEKRSHDNELTSGVGGAGLYSDGKLSFYPSASKLWHLKPTATFSEAYKRVTELLTLFGVESPLFNYEESQEPLEASGIANYKKRYPSIYMPLAKRVELISFLENSSSGKIISNTAVVGVDYDRDSYKVSLNNNETKMQYNIYAKKIVFCTGKFGPLHLPKNVGIRKTFLRLETGIRIEQPCDEFFLRDDDSVDPKYIINNIEDYVQWRTFCCCRNGEIAEIRDGGCVSVSGRSDVERTSLSNVGVLARFQDFDADRWSEFVKVVGAGQLAEREELGKWLCPASTMSTRVARVLGVQANGAARAGVLRLIDLFGRKRFRDAVVVGPAVEGVGFYPETTENLRGQARSMWFAGDICGRFRGVIAAMVSGYFVGLEIIKAFNDE